MTISPEFSRPTSGSGPGLAPAGGAPTIFTANAQNFQSSVLMASMQRPVLAYFTASWCGPCKQLRPVLERAVLALGGKVSLAVIDIDANPDLATAMRVQSVPQVYGFVAGQPVDGFMGAVPESQIKTFIANLLKLAGQAAEEEAAEAAEIAATPRRDWEDGNLAAAITGYQANGNAAAVEFLKRLLPLGAATVLMAAEENSGGGTAEALHHLALARLAQGQFESGIDAIIGSFKADRKWADEQARRDFVLLSEILGPGDAFISAGRRKLSAMMFS